MAILDLPYGGSWVPPADNYPAVPSIGSSTNLSLNGTTRQRIAWIFEVPKTGTLDKAEAYCGFISSPSDIKFSFQDLSAGVPDNTADQYRVVASGSVAVGWIVPGLMTSDGTDVGSKRSVTRGDVIAVVVEWNSTQSGQVWFYGSSNNNTAVLGSSMPYCAVHNGTSYSKFTEQNHNMLLKYDDGTYAAAVGVPWVGTVVNTRSFASNSTPDERGMVFTFDADVEIDGAWVWLDLNADADIVLYDTDGTTALLTRSLESDNQQGTNPNRRHIEFAPIAINGGGVYRLVVKPTTTTSVSIYEFTLPSAAIMGGIPGGADFHLTTRTDAGSWTETTTQRPIMGVRLSGVDDGTGAGGGGGATQLVSGGMVS